MTLATRCTACGTSFRVVPDQLKVSGGWVRCGRCNEVFNAREQLYEIYTAPVENPPAGPARGPADAAASSGAIEATAAHGTSAVGPDASAPGTPAAPSPVSAARAANHGHGFGPAPDEHEGAQPRTEAPVQASAASVAGLAAPATPSAAAPDIVLPDDEGGPGLTPVSTALVVHPMAATLGDDGPEEPSFMRAPDPPPAPPSLPQRLAWGAVGALLWVLLGGQAALAYRDDVVARWPQALPVLESACAVVGCEVGPLRQVASFSVEDSNLRQLARESVYDLTVTLRNRSDLPLMMPAFDLTLTDAQGRPVLRRVLAAAELGHRSRVLGPRAEAHLSVTVDADDRRVAGYTIEIFYP